MRSARLLHLIIVAVLLALVPAVAPAAEAVSKPLVHPLFSSGMVLQRGVADPVWGWTDPNAEVSVSINNMTAKATAGADGKWETKVGPFEAGGPFEMVISAGGKQLKLADVLVGDVWICSGQSNMEMGIGNVLNAQQEIADADHPQLRLFTVPKFIANEPQSLLNPNATPNQSKWLVCSPQTVAAEGWGGFSAVGYFFGRDLEKELHVPIGLIHTSWGGTIAEAWTSAEALKKNLPEFDNQVEAVEAAAKSPKSAGETLADWYAKHDPGSSGSWQKTDAGDGDWKSMKLPQHWESAGVGMDNFDGIVWFRKEVELPAAWAGKKLMLHLGPIDDIDTTWVNGVKVGSESGYQTPRNYAVPPTAISGNKAVIAIRVLDTGGEGGVWGQPQDLKLEAEGSSEPAVSLAGEWKYKIGADLKETGQPPAVMGNGNPNVTTVLFNGMINPLVPFAIKGAIWYQGESNAGRGMQYRTLLPTMIRDWRSRFGVGEFPFFIVQLANFMEQKPEPTESAWAELREAQSITGETVGKSAIASAIDIGDAKDIHPKNKQEVGRRLALDALAIAYGKDVVHSGPVFDTMEKKGDTLVLHFKDLGGGLEAKGGGSLKGFAIAGDDKHFVWADATIEGDTVVVKSDKVKDPTIVRYAWADNPEANLYNKAGLPATPFRSDSPK